MLVVSPSSMGCQQVTLDTEDSLKDSPIISKSTVFCTNKVIILLPILLKFPSSLSGIVPRHPITTGTIFTVFIFHNSFISMARLRYSWTFSSCLLSTLLPPRHATSIIWDTLSFLQMMTISRQLCSSHLSVYILKSHRIVMSSFSTAFSGVCSNHFFPHRSLFKTHNS